MAAADVVVLASGTATLEALLLKKPMVVVYKLAPVSWFLVVRLAITRFAALPNILAGESVVPELLQGEANPEAVAAQVVTLLDEPAAREAQSSIYRGIHQQLRCDYAQRSADALLGLISSRD